MTELDKLIGAVESGVDTAHHHAAAFPSESAYGKCTWHDSHKASSGSLDAAKALHEALLPGWIWERRGSEMVVQHWDDEFSNEDTSNPARAWLTAILKAYQSLK